LATGSAKESNSDTEWAGVEPQQIHPATVSSSTPNFSQVAFSDMSNSEPAECREHPG
jgi:hypothetical protein